jgi:hypothetical protein
LKIKTRSTNAFIVGCIDDGNNARPRSIGRAFEVENGAYLDADIDATNVIDLDVLFRIIGRDTTSTSVCSSDIDDGCLKSWPLGLCCCWKSTKHGQSGGGRREREREEEETKKRDVRIESNESNAWKRIKISNPVPMPVARATMTGD